MAAVNATKNGNWSDTTVWSTGSLPGASDDVSLLTYNVTLDQNATVLSLTWTTGLLTVSGTRTLTTAVNPPSNVGGIVVPVGTTLNLVGTITFTGTSNYNTTTTSYLRVSGTCNHTGDLLSRQCGTLVNVVSGGSYTLTGNISTTSTVQNAGGNPWIYVATGGTASVTGNIYLGWTLGYTVGCINSYGTLTFNGAISIGQNTLTGYYDTSAIMVSGGTANVTLTNATFLTNGIGNTVSLFYFNGSSISTINATGFTMNINKVRFYIGQIFNTASVTYNGDVNVTASTNNTILFYMSGGTLVFNGACSQTTAQGCTFFDIRGGSATITGNMTATPSAGNSFLISAQGAATVAYTGTTTLNGSQSGGNGSQAFTANAASTVVTVNGNIILNGNWQRPVYALTSGRVNVNGNMTIASTGQCGSGFAYAEASGVIVITGNLDCGGTVGSNIGLYAQSLGSVTITGTAKRSGILSTANNNATAYALIYQNGTGTITVNGSIEVLSEVGATRWFYYTDLTKITWNPGVSGHFTYLNWSFGGNDYPLASAVLAPTSYGFGAFTGTATDVSGQVTAALTAQGLTVARAAKLDYLTSDIATNTQVNTRLAASGYTAPDNASITAIKNKTDNLPADPASNTQVNTRLAAGSYTAPDNTSIAAIKNKTDNLPADPASNTQVNTRLAANAYTAPANSDITAIKNKTDNLPADPASNTQVNTRLAASDYVVPANSDIAAIKTKTDNLPADPASNTQVNTRLAADAYTAPANSDITAIKNKTDNLPADPASNTQVNTRLAASDYVAPDDTAVLAAVNTRLAAADYTAPDNSKIAAIKNKTDNLPNDPTSEMVVAAQIATRLSANSYMPPDNAGIAAIKNRTDNLPADPASATQVATRFAADAYITPDNATLSAVQVKVNEIKTLLDSGNIGGGGDASLSPEVVTMLEQLTRVLGQNIRVMQAASVR